MKRFLVIFIILGISNILVAQYSSGYESGFAYGCKCNDRVPTGDYLYKQGSYNEGYEDGKIDGNFYSLKKEINRNYESSKRQYPKYFQQENLNLLYYDLYNKQRIIDERRNYIRYLANEFNYILVNIPFENISKYNKELQEISDDFYRRGNKYVNYNLLNSSLFQDIVNDLNRVKNKLYNYY